MSVTFTAETPAGPDTRVFRITCSDGTVLGEYVGYDNAYAEAGVHGLLCTIGVCPGYGADVDEVYADGDPRPVNAANRNAMDLLAALGYPLDLEDPQLFGEESAQHFLGRVETALALAPADEGLPAIEFRDDRGAMHVDCARRPGYLHERLAELRELALACQARGLRVTWA